MEKIDRRVKRTHKLLAEAFLALIAEKPYEAITIREITERADIAYATFFRHYQDKNDLFLTILADDVGELKVRMAAITPQSGDEDEACASLFRHIQNKEVLYRSLFSGPGTAVVREQMKMWYVEQILQTNQAYYTPTSAIPFEVAANHTAAACVELIDWWLNHDMPYSAERMGDILCRLIINGTWQIVAESAAA